MNSVLNRPTVVTEPPPPTTTPYIPPYRPDDKDVVGPRIFKAYEYEKYKHLPGMPSYIPQLTPLHYICMIVPTVLFLVLYLHHRDSNAKDLAEEEQKMKSLKWLLGLGGLVATFVMCVHLQMIPARYVRAVFPQWKQPTPISKPMKILIVFVFMVFIVYPTYKFFRRRNEQGQREPRVHKFSLDN